MRGSLKRARGEQRTVQGETESEPVGSRTDTVERGKIWLDEAVLKTGRIYVKRFLGPPVRPYAFT